MDKQDGQPGPLAELGPEEQMQTPGGDTVDRDDVAGRGRIRRAAGIAVFAALVVVLVAVSAVRGRVVTGDPTAPPVTAAPQVGDCILENPHARGADLLPTTAPLAVLRTGACSAPRFGEVVTVGGGYPDGTDVPTAAIDQCFQQASGYLGLPDSPPRAALPTGPAVAVWFVLVGPDRRQHAAGQDWAACVVFLPVSLEVSAPITVDHSLRGAWNRPEDSRLFGLCLNDVGSMDAANCMWPHRFEVMTFAPGDPAASPESEQAACTRDVVQALGSPAALNRGEVSVLVVPARPDPDRNGLITGPAAVTAGTGYGNICILRPSDTRRMLTSSVRGLLDAPLPLN